MKTVLFGDGKGMVALVAGKPVTTKVADRKASVARGTIRMTDGGRSKAKQRTNMRKRLKRSIKK